MARKAHSAAKKAEVEGSGTVVAVTEVEVTHYPRIHGAPTGAKLRVILKAMRELIKMRMKMREITHEQEGLYARKVALEAERQAV